MSIPLYRKEFVNLWSLTNGFRSIFFFLYYNCGSHCFFLKFTLKIRVGVIIVTLENEFGTIVIVYFRDCEYLLFIE